MTAEACDGVDVSCTVVCARLTDVVVGYGSYFRAILIAIWSLFGGSSTELGGGLAVGERDSGCEIDEMLHDDHVR